MSFIVRNLDFHLIHTSLVLPDHHSKRHLDRVGRFSPQYTLVTNGQTDDETRPVRIGPLYAVRVCVCKQVTSACSGAVSEEATR